MEFKCAYRDLVHPDTLVPNPRNPNKHPEKQIKMLAKIIEHQGQRAPIVVSKRSGFITKGHGRLEAIKLLGWDQVAIDVQDYKNEAEEFQDMVADNKIAELADHDDNFMIESMKELELMETDLELLGIDNFNFSEVSEVKNTGAELDLDSFNNFDHQCPKCGFEWSDNGQDNS